MKKTIYLVLGIFFFSLFLIPSNVKAASCVNLTNLGDTYVTQMPADSNQGTYSRLEVESYSGVNERSWIKFNSSSIPSSQSIVNATLYLYYYNNAGTSPSAVQFKHITRLTDI